MKALFTYLRSMKRLIKICAILIRQYVFRLPCRLIIDPSAQNKGVISKYLTAKKQTPNAPVIARETLEKLGPTFVKFGQFLSVRPDLIPQDFCQEFKKLQDRVLPFPIAQVRKELKNELNLEISEIFSEFEDTAAAAASISQVHRARLRTGEEVAVKVQRPGIREEMVSDLHIMLLIATFIERFVPSLRKNRPVMLIREFSRWTDRELYFRQEGKNALHFAYNFRDYPGVKIPRVYREHTTKKILVTEYIHGMNLMQGASEGIDRSAMARRIADSMLKQIFIDGFFHGDPHGGNILLVDRETIAYLDFGIVGHLSEDLRAWIIDILYGISKGDVSRVISSLLEMCDVREGDIDLGAYRRQMHEVLSELPVYEVAGTPFSHLLERFLNTSLDVGIRIPQEFVLVTKAITTLEGTCLSLDPEIRIVEQLRIFIRKQVSQAPSYESLLGVVQAAPLELERLRRIMLKHGTKVMRGLEYPGVCATGPGGREVRTVNGGRGMMSTGRALIISSLIIFSAIMSRNNELDRLLRTYSQVPALPVLSLLSLALAGLLAVKSFSRNRSRNAGGSDTAEPGQFSCH